MFVLSDYSVGRQADGSLSVGWALLPVNPSATGKSARPTTGRPDSTARFIGEHERIRSLLR